MSSIYEFAEFTCVDFLISSIFADMFHTIEIYNYGKSKSILIPIKFHTISIFRIFIFSPSVITF